MQQGTYNNACLTTRPKNHIISLRKITPKEQTSQYEGYPSSVKLSVCHLSTSKIFKPRLKIMRWKKLYIDILRIDYPTTPSSLTTCMCYFTPLPLCPLSSKALSFVYALLSFIVPQCLTPPHPSPLLRLHPSVIPISLIFSPLLASSFHPLPLNLPRTRLHSTTL